MIAFCVILTLVCSLRACHMWLTRNHMFICEIWGKFTLFIFWNFRISLVSLGSFQNFKKVEFIPNFPLKHVITSTNLMVFWMTEVRITWVYQNLWIAISLFSVDLWMFHLYFLLTWYITTAVLIKIFSEFWKSLWIRGELRQIINVWVNLLVLIDNHVLLNIPRTN